MAKYNDYVKQGSVEQELSEARPRSKNIPESVVKRFDGKSLDDVLESYAELQVLNSRQGEDLGKLRKTVDQLLELQSQVLSTPSAPATAEPDTGITPDDLYTDPETAVRKVVKRESKETAERIEKLEKSLQQREIELSKTDLGKKYPGWDNEIVTPEFRNWVESSPARTRLYQSANQYDFAAASDLLELWYDKKGSRQQVDNHIERERQFRDATLESSSPASADVVPAFSRSDLMQKRVAAKSGNRAAEQWLRDNASAISIAYQEGRLTD